MRLNTSRCDAQSAENALSAMLTLCAAAATRPKLLDDVRRQQGQAQDAADVEALIFSAAAIPASDACDRHDDESGMHRPF
jgi:hypothetical protein